MTEKPKKVLVLGSGPNVMAAQNWPRDAFDHLLAINNAWAVRPDWDELIHPEDFPMERRPVDVADGKRITTASDYVPAQNAYGGFVYAGGTMAFTAGYWSLLSYRPSVLAYVGCDMVYGSGQTHFYGSGEADPLRADVSLQSLEAKSARLMITAAMQGCSCVNLSEEESRLVFQRAEPDTLADVTPISWDEALANEAFAREEALGYFVASGRYWEEAESFDPEALREIDALWLAAARLAP